MRRTIFFLSDGTGITAETLGHSLLTQFEAIQFEKITIPYIDDTDKANAAVEKINQAATTDGCKPLVFSTLVNPEIRDILTTSKGLLLDFFDAFIHPLEQELQIRSTHRIGRMHGLVDYNAYMTRINAVNYTLIHDDGIGSKNYEQADIILVGVSRCGKTPTCLYLALQFGISAANYPFTEEDMDDLKLPAALQQNRAKLFGLTIEPERLQLIRQERRPNSQYSSLEQCKLEVAKVEELLKREKIPYLCSTARSIEEIATSIAAAMGIKRRLG